MGRTSQLSRRRFLTFSAGLAGSALVPAGAQASGRKLDIAIIGGGMAGLYCAYRLAQDSSATIGLFEASDRIGGRVLSVLFEGFDNLAAEMGAMRLRSTDTISIKLAKTLLGEASLAPFVYPTKGYYLRDRRLDGIDDPDQLPYFLNDEESRLLSDGRNLIVESVKSLADDRDGIAHHGLRELLLRSRSRDGFHLMEDITGYDTVFANWDATAAVDWFLADFAPGTRYHAVRGGMERIPAALAEAAAAKGVDISIDSALTAIRRVGASSFRLSIRTGQANVEVDADRVILAIPPAALKTVDDPDGLFSSAGVAAALSSVQPKSLGKIHMSFDTAWWKDTGSTRGRLITDLPVRQSYMFGQDERSGRGLLMASYHGGRFNEYWRSLGRGPKYADGAWVRAAKSVNGRSLPASIVRETPASRLVAEEIMRQTRTIYGVSDPIPDPLAVSIRDWSLAGSGAGWHQWIIGTDPDGTISFLRQPQPGLHICGEAWSRDQGWIAGAVRTAEDMLNEQFGLSPFVQSTGR